MGLTKIIRWIWLSYDAKSVESKNWQCIVVYSSITIYFFLFSWENYFNTFEKLKCKWTEETLFPFTLLSFYPKTEPWYVATHESWKRNCLSISENTAENCCTKTRESINYTWFCTRPNLRSKMTEERALRCSKWHLSQYGCTRKLTLTLADLFYQPRSHFLLTNVPESCTKIQEQQLGGCI